MAASKGLREAFKVSRAVAGGVILSDEDDTTAAHYAEQVPRGYLVGEYGKTASCCHLYRYKSGLRISGLFEDPFLEKLREYQESKWII